MEASGAGLAGGNAGDGQAQAGDAAAGGAGDAGAAAGGTSADVVAQFGELAEGLRTGQFEMKEQMQTFLEANKIAPAAETQEANLPDLQSIADEPDPAKAAQALKEMVETAAERRAQQLVEEKVGPLQETVSGMQQQRDADMLIAEFPDLGKPEVAKEVMASAEDLAKLMGQPELAGNAAFVRQTFLAGRASQLAQEQQNGAAQAPGAATLEGANGASPGGAGQGATPQQQSEAREKAWGGRQNVLSKL